MGSRGQIFTWDLIFSMMLFTITLALVFYLWDSTTKKIADSEETYKMGWITTLVAEQLVRVPGEPPNWTADDVIVFGLAEDENVVGFDEIQDRKISPKKFLTLVNMSYNDYTSTKAKLLRSGKYEFYIDFSCRDKGHPRGPLHCFENLTVEGMDGVVNCANGVSIVIEDGITHNESITPQPDRCLVGDYRPLSEIRVASPAVKNAVFSENPDVTDPFFSASQELNKAITMTVVVYKPKYE